jgi:hypothetical protein
MVFAIRVPLRPLFFVRKLAITTPSKEELAVTESLANNHPSSTVPNENSV